MKDNIKIDFVLNFMLKRGKVTLVSFQTKENLSSFTKGEGIFPGPDSNPSYHRKNKNF